VAGRVERLLAEAGIGISGATVLLLGVTYKADIGDSRESPSLPLAESLRDRGATVVFHDPYHPTWTVQGEVLQRVPDLDAALRKSDVTVLVQAHSAYDLTAVATTAQRLFDTRGRVSDAGVERL